MAALISRRYYIKKSEKLMSLKNIYEIISNKILPNKAQQYIKTIIHYDQMGFISEVTGWFDIQKSITLITIRRK